jgi:hypothetical protein
VGSCSQVLARGYRRWRRSQDDSASAAETSTPAPRSNPLRESHIGRYFDDDLLLVKGLGAVGDLHVEVVVILQLHRHDEAPEPHLQSLLRQRIVLRDIAPHGGHPFIKWADSGEEVGQANRVSAVEECVIKVRQPEFDGLAVATSEDQAAPVHGGDGR